MSAAAVALRSPSGASRSGGLDNGSAWVWPADAVAADGGAAPWGNGHAAPDAVGGAWSTGHAPLDGVLPGGGWPASGVIELLAEGVPASDDDACVALPWASLLARGWVARGRAQALAVEAPRGPLVWVLPDAFAPQSPQSADDVARPAPVSEVAVTDTAPRRGGGTAARALSETAARRLRPGAPAGLRPAQVACDGLAGWQQQLAGWAALGWPSDRWLVVRAAAPRDALWACEQALACRDVPGVLAWLPQATLAQLRRLHLKAIDHARPLFVGRAAASEHEASPAPLRVAVGWASDGSHLGVRIVKRRGPPLREVLRLEPWWIERWRGAQQAPFDRRPSHASQATDDAAPPSATARRLAAGSVPRPVRPSMPASASPPAAVEAPAMACAVTARAQVSGAAPRVAPPRLVVVGDESAMPTAARRVAAEPR